jgi:hypothetical protein
MFRSGNYASGEKFCKEASIKMSTEFKNQFRELFEILNEIKDKNLEAAMRWARDKSNELESIKSDLLFRLYKQ